MKKHYFDHDYSARNDQKILHLRYKHGAEGYGIYYMLLEIMAEDSTGYIQEKDIGGLTIALSLPEATLKGVLQSCVDIGLFKRCEHGNYYSDRMIKHKSYMNDFCVFGKKGAEIKRNLKEATSPPTSPSATNESRVKESRVKESNNTAFKKPEIEEIQKYCVERKNGVDAQRFFDFYESKGWRVGNTPMKNWQAAVRTWEQRDNNSQSPVSVEPIKPKMTNKQLSEALDKARYVDAETLHAR